MCSSCGCEAADKLVQFQCACPEEKCTCDSIIEFDTKPQAVPYCCGFPMKRIK